MKVGIKANGERHLWDFPGDAEGLKAAWAEGRVPVHLDPAHPERAFAGSLERVERLPVDLLAILEVGGKKCTFYIDDDVLQGMPGKKVKKAKA